MIRTHHPSKKKKRKCHPERSIRISARSLLSALNHFRSVSKDLHFPARTTPHLKGKRKPSHPERSIRISARRFWRAESIQKRVEGPAFLSSPKTNPTCPILARLCRAIGSNTAALNRPQHFSTNQNCHPERVITIIYIIEFASYKSYHCCCAGSVQNICANFSQYKFLWVS